jgi:TonB-linked SusC/RagA family outer membrane protein
MSTALPYYPVYNADSTFNSYPSSANGDNPLIKQELLQWKNFENRTINNLTINIIPIPKLTISATGGIDYMDLREERYEPSEFINDNTHSGFAKSWPSFIMNKTGGITSNYELDLNENNRFTFLVGAEIQSSKKTSYYKEAKDVDGPYWEGFNEGPNYVPKRDNITPDEWAFVSFFSRIHYVYKEKYIFQILTRTDGSSRFGSNNKFGFFPAVSAAWRISEEDFLKDNSILSNLRLRASYGITGNANIPSYAWVGTYSPSSSNTLGYNGHPITYPGNLENPNLQWEELHNFDAGIEFGFLKNRITGELSYYNKISKKVLIKRSNAPSTGFDAFWDNIGEVLNRGVEFSLHSNNLVGTFTWTTDFNIASNHNEVLSIGDLTPDAVGGGTNDTRIVVGKPVGSNFLVRFSRVDPADGLPVWLDKEGNETKTFSLDNRVVVGSVIPDAIGAITNTFGYKNFDFSFMLVYTIGGNIYDNSGKRQLGVITDWNLRKEITDRWREPGDVAQYPLLTLTPTNYPGLANEWQYNSTMFLYDASYVRLRNITLGYTLPKGTSSKLKVSNARFYFIASNLLTFTKFKGDPEIARDFENVADRNMSSNITYLTPPQEQTFSFGIELIF